MAITIQGIRIERLSLNRENDALKMSGEYTLMSSVGTALAKQSFNDYGGITYTLSPESEKALRDLRNAVISDFNKLLGLE